MSAIRDFQWFYILNITLFSYLLPSTLLAQEIIDPCFESVQELGFFYGSDNVKNICGCDPYYYNLASDMIEWNGYEWQGTYPNSLVDLPPPEGCNNKAMWCGFSTWTPGGEGIALKLDKPLEAGKAYSYTFTYASNGRGMNGDFSPIVYTHQNSSTLSFNSASYAGRMPGTDGWTTKTITFTAKGGQQGHQWIMLRALESSGIIMADCQSKLNGIQNTLGSDREICDDDEITLELPNNKYFQYSWSTGDANHAITTGEPGYYSVTVTYGACNAHADVTIGIKDCEVRLTMPNFFSPNNDEFNPIFKPIEFNYLEAGNLVIYNRWGQIVFNGDLFTGWDGTFNGEVLASGVYYYTVFYKPIKGDQQDLKGWVTLVH